MTLAGILHSGSSHRFLKAGLLNPDGEAIHLYDIWGLNIFGAAGDLMPPGTTQKSLLSKCTSFSRMITLSICASNRVLSERGSGYWTRCINDFCDLKRADSQNRPICKHKNALSNVSNILNSQYG